MAKYLVIFTDNHNEEFDVNGFKIMSEKEANDFEDLATSITWEFSYFASSQSLNFSNGEDFLTRIEFKEITKTEFDSLDKMFNGEFGTFISYEYLQVILEGDESLDSDDIEDEDWD